MSDTPLTDEQLLAMDIVCTDSWGEVLDVVPVEFARGLERRVRELEARIAEMEDERRDAGRERDLTE